jgi:hypothetical protein
LRTTPAISQRAKRRRTWQLATATPAQSFELACQLQNNPDATVFWIGLPPYLYVIELLPSHWGGDMVSADWFFKLGVAAVAILSSMLILMAMI